MKPRRTLRRAYPLPRAFYRSYSVLMALRVYTVIGALGAIIGGGYFLTSLLPDSLTKTQTAVLITSGVSLALAIMSRMMLTMIRERNVLYDRIFATDRKQANLLRMWFQFEESAKDVLADLGEDQKTHSTRELIKELRSHLILDNVDSIALQEAMLTRNAVAHGMPLASTYEVEEVTEKLAQVLSKLTGARPHIPASDGNGA